MERKQNDKEFKGHFDDITDEKKDKKDCDSFMEK